MPFQAVSHGFKDRPFELPFNPVTGQGDTGRQESHNSLPKPFFDGLQGCRTPRVRGWLQIRWLEGRQHRGDSVMCQGQNQGKSGFPLLKTQPLFQGSECFLGFPVSFSACQNPDKLGVSEADSPTRSQPNPSQRSSQLAGIVRNEFQEAGWHDSCVMGLWQDDAPRKLMMSKGL